jgi:uncharacterized protein YgbK (DUF1537 family)
LHLQCLVIADDLTGACDAAAQFVSSGRRVRVSLSLEKARGSVDVLAVSTESRDAPVGSFGKSLKRLPPLRPRIIFKKIDSTLRGNVGSEVAAVMAAFHCKTAVVTPAFPAMGRVVERGYLRTADPAFEPCELAACFHGIDCPEMVLRDAVCDADLDAIVAEFIHQERVLWAGSAGLAAALARSLGHTAAIAETHLRSPALFCLGSNHAVTLEQEERLVRHRAAVTMAAEAATPESLHAALVEGRPMVLRIRRDRTSAEQIAELLDEFAAPFVLSGGDTAALVCDALGVRVIELRQEIAPGIPCGILGGGPFAGLPVVTKSGGFGSPDALIEVADFFTCQPSL